MPIRDKTIVIKKQDIFADTETRLVVFNEIRKVMYNYLFKSSNPFHIHIDDFKRIVFDKPRAMGKPSRYAEAMRLALCDKKKQISQDRCKPLAIKFTHRGKKYSIHTNAIQIALKLQQLCKEDESAFKSSKIGTTCGKNGHDGFASFWIESIMMERCAALIEFRVSEHLPMRYFQFQMSGGRPIEFKSTAWDSKNTGQVSIKYTYKKFSLGVCHY